MGSGMPDGRPHPPDLSRQGTFSGGFGGGDGEGVVTEAGDEVEASAECRRGRGLAPSTSPRLRGFVNVLTRQSVLQGVGLFCQLPSAVPVAHLLIGFGSQYL
jgi:hypothetical protein